MPVRPLLVAANPYCALSSEGLPAGAVPRFDMPSGRFGGAVTYVGAVLDAARSTDDHRVYLFDGEPVAVADLPAYRVALRCGDLLPADALTARLVGVPFVPLPEALATARAQAASRYQAVTGEPAPFLDTPHEPAPVAAQGDA
jgi:hypothetical protein